MDFIKNRFSRFDAGWTWNEGGRWLTLSFLVNPIYDPEIQDWTEIRHFRVWVGGRRSIEFTIRW